MAYLLLLSVFWGLCSAVVGVVYAVVLAGEDIPVLNRWFDLLAAGRDRGGWWAFVASPFGGCAKCCSGQLALWSSSIFVPWSFWGPSIAAHILAACSAVLFATVLSHGYRWLSRKM